MIENTMSSPNLIELTAASLWGFREPVGETDARDFTAAVAHPERWVP